CRSANKSKTDTGKRSAQTHRNLPPEYDLSTLYLLLSVARSRCSQSYQHISTQKQPGGDKKTAREVARLREDYEPGSCADAMTTSTCECLDSMRSPIFMSDCCLLWVSLAPFGLKVGCNSRRLGLTLLSFSA